MDMYLEFTEKGIKKYMKMLYSQYFDEEIVSEYLRTYINARYYNIRNTDKPARAFYLRIEDELEFKKQILMKKYGEEKAKIIGNVQKVFEYILFFDNVRKIENYKKIKDLRDIIKKMLETVKSDFPLKISKDQIENIHKEIAGDMIKREVFLDNLETDEFSVKFYNNEENEEIYYATLDHKVKMPMQYSDMAIEKVFTEGIVAEDKLQVEYLLLSLISVRDIIDGNFKDIYIAEFAKSLFNKKTKLDGLLTIIENQALQAKINLNINYEDYIKNQAQVLEYTKKGYNFAITLDDTIENIEDVEKLRMFKIVIAPKDLILYKELKQNKAISKNVIFI